MRSELGYFAHSLILGIKKHRSFKCNQQTKHLFRSGFLCFRHFRLFSDLFRHFLTDAVTPLISWTCAERSLAITLILHSDLECDLNINHHTVSFLFYYRNIFLTHSVPDHIKMWSDTIILDKVFYLKKIWIMYQKKEKIFLQKMSPHLAQLNVAMAHRNYFRRNNLRILKLATYTKIEDHYFRCILATF